MHFEPFLRLIVSPACGVAWAARVLTLSCLLPFSCFPSLFSLSPSQERHRAKLADMAARRKAEEDEAAKEAERAQARRKRFKEVRACVDPGGRSERGGGGRGRYGG